MSKTRIRQLLTDARNIAAKAQAERRDLTDSEHSTVTAKLTEATRLKAQLGHSPLVFAHELAAAEDASPSTLEGPAGFGAKLAAPAAANSWAKTIRQMGAKALVPSGTIDVPLLDQTPHGFGAGPTLLGRVIPVQPLDETGQFKYLRQTVRTNNAAAVAPGNLKPTSVISIEPVTGTAQTIATLSEPIDNVTLADSVLLEDFVAGELRNMVNVEVNAQLLNGDGIAPNLAGVLAAADVQQQAFDTSALVSIRKAKTKVGSVYDGLIPDQALLHPNDAEGLDLAQDLEGRFYFGGPVSGNTEQTWRIPVFETTAVPEGTAIVGNFRTATRAYLREDVRVTWSEAVPIDVEGTPHAAFELNQRVYRAETRLGLAILRPAALVAVALTDSATS